MKPIMKALLLVGLVASSATTFSMKKQSTFADPEVQDRMVLDSAIFNVIKTGKGLEDVETSLKRGVSPSTIRVGLHKNKPAHEYVTGLLQGDIPDSFRSGEVFVRINRQQIESLKDLLNQYK